MREDSETQPLPYLFHEPGYVYAALSLWLEELGSSVPKRGRTGDEEQKVTPLNARKLSRSCDK